MRVAGIWRSTKRCYEKGSGKPAWTGVKCGNGMTGAGAPPPCRSTGQALAMLAHAFLAAVRRQANECSGGKEGESRNGMKPCYR